LWINFDASCPMFDRVKSICIINLYATSPPNKCVVVVFVFSNNICPFNIWALYGTFGHSVLHVNNILTYRLSVCIWCVHLCSVPFLDRTTTSTTHGVVNCCNYLRYHRPVFIHQRYAWHRDFFFFLFIRYDTFANDSLRAYCFFYIIKPLGISDGVLRYLPTCRCLCESAAESLWFMIPSRQWYPHIILVVTH